MAELEKQVEKPVTGIPASLVAEMVGPKAKERWTSLQPAQQRSLLAAMGFELELVAGMRGGPGFKPESVKIRFVRDEA
ncbi:MAG: hypothetical protein WBA97_26080 [Actinophytocola sp.]|uniref:hypothetical protein n=1 Tax=Actinophytocola sp. TaxID=1872138 RepID=UPI003C707428